MKIQKLEEDIILFRGESYQSVATAFIAKDEVLLVDALASTEDAQALRGVLEDELGKSVRTIILTHCMADHAAGLRLFPSATIVAHRYFSHTFWARRGTSPKDFEWFVAPGVVFDNELTIDHGHHRLRLFHNPGKTMCSIGIDVEASDLLFGADNVLGNIVFISGSAPELIHSALENLESRPRGRLVAGHMGVFGSPAARNARIYLRTLEARVGQARAIDADKSAQSVLKIKIDECIAPGVVPSDFEREWHGHNLTLINERNLFFVDTGGATVAGASLAAR